MSETVLSSLWDGLSDHLIATFYAVESGEGASWSRTPGEPTVQAPLTEATIDVQLQWQSPFENSGAEAGVPTLAAMLQSGAFQPVIDATIGAVMPDTSSNLKSQLAAFEGRTGITKLNSTQVFNGMPPVRITCTALFRAWRDGRTEVDAPVDQLMRWALPTALSPDGSILARAAETARGDMGLVDAAMPSLSPTKVAMRYKGRTYCPLVIESIGFPLSSPVNSTGNFVQVAVSITLCTLTAIDRTDWENAKTLKL